MKKMSIVLTSALLMGSGLYSMETDSAPAAQSATATTTTAQQPATEPTAPAVAPQTSVQQTEPVAPVASAQTTEKISEETRARELVSNSRWEPGTGLLTMVNGQNTDVYTRENDGSWKKGDAHKVAAASKVTDEHEIAGLNELVRVLELRDQQIQDQQLRVQSRLLAILAASVARARQHIVEHPGRTIAAAVLLVSPMVATVMYPAPITLASVPGYFAVPLATAVGPESVAALGRLYAQGRAQLRQAGHSVANRGRQVAGHVGPMLQSGISKAKKTAKSAQKNCSIQ